MPEKKQDDEAEMDAWIEAETTRKVYKCMLCETPGVVEELEKVETRLRSKKPVPARVPISAVARWLQKKKLLPCAPKQLSAHLQKDCHRSFYNYLKGME